ncbi:MAG TPA: FGGY family carbohydrate kinase [Solirubrobacteraceae bacterium]
MSAPLLLGIDEGTTAVKAALFDLELRCVAQARRPVPVEHPAPGRVEQDPALVLEAVMDSVAELLGRAGDRPVAAAGIAHQGESVLAWDADSGETLTQVIVWQDKRQEPLLAEIAPADVERSGLPLDPYFSAGRLAWLLRNDARVRSALDGGRLRLGTVDAYLTDRLGGRFATDLSTASRTQLLATGGRDWDEQLLATFGIRRELLPDVGPTFGSLGELRCARWPAPIALCAQLVDQQAALAGSGAVGTGELKATYGTGVFVLGRTSGVVAASGLLPTVGWAGSGVGDAIGEIAYALEGGVFAAGSLLDWLAHGLGLAPDARALAGLAATVADSGGVMMLPALAGLGAPWWRPGARGVISGLHPGVRPAHVARAALEAIAWRVADIVAAFAEVAPVRGMRVDGGLTNDPTLLQIQADALGMPLLRGPADATVLGSAMLAGVGAGVFGSVEDAARLLPDGGVVSPGPAGEEHLAGRERWRAFVAASAAL